MRSPTLIEISDNLILVPRFIVAVFAHYFFAGGGSILGTILLFYPGIYQGVRTSGWWLVAVLFLIAMYLAWLEQYRSVRAIEIRDRLDWLVSRGEIIQEQWWNGKNPRWGTKRWIKTARSFVRRHFALAQIDTFNTCVSGVADDEGEQALDARIHIDSKLQKADPKGDALAKLVTRTLGALKMARVFIYD